MKSALFTVTGLVASFGSCAVNIEHIHSVPDGWQKLNDTVNPSQPIRLAISLRQPEMKGLKAKMASSESHLRLHDIKKLRAPSPKDVHDVSQWLAENSMPSISKDDWIYVNTTVGRAEPLLGMTLGVYSFEGKKPVLRTTQYSVPESVSNAITFIHPLANFMAPKQGVQVMSAAAVTQFRAQAESSETTTALCASAVTPTCLRQLYNINYSVPENRSPVRFAVAGFLEQYGNHVDLQKFLQQYDPIAGRSNHDFAVELSNGGQNPQVPSQAGSEAGLDLEYTVSIGFPTNVTFISTAGRGVELDDNGKPILDTTNDNEPYLEFFQYLLDKADDEIPHVISISYSDDELSVPHQYATKICDLIGLLTSRGTSIISASGDGGSAGGQHSNCRTNDGTNREITMATFPASCPWITSVGATTNFAEPPQGAFFSSGGFSRYFPRQEWQEAAVEKYAKLLDGHLDGFYNKSMRAIPDVAAVGTRFITIVNGKQQVLDGTSASTPVFASIIALINDARLSRGKESLGWLNERLYSAEVQAVFQDITSGESASCTFDGNQPGGWPAKEGWDAITGLGVPKDFTRLLEVLST